VGVNQYFVVAVTFMSIWESVQPLAMPVPNTLYAVRSIKSSCSPSSLRTVDRTEPV